MAQREDKALSPIQADCGRHQADAQWSPATRVRRGLARSQALVALFLIDNASARNAIRTPSVVPDGGRRVTCSCRRPERKRHPAGEIPGALDQGQGRPGGRAGTMTVGSTLWREPTVTLQ